MDNTFKETHWFQYLDHGMKDLVTQSLELLEAESSQAEDRFHDYSFIVFPVAKAYEGFLKKFLFDLDLISEQDVQSWHFRIGRSLNPDLPGKYRDRDWLFHRLENLTTEYGDKHLAMEMWDAWREARNRIFHYYFPDHSHFISLVDAKSRVEMVTNVMDRAMNCGLLEPDATSR